MFCVYLAFLLSCHPYGIDYQKFLSRGGVSAGRGGSSSARCDFLLSCHPFGIAYQKFPSIGGVSAVRGGFSFTRLFHFLVSYHPYGIVYHQFLWRDVLLMLCLCFLLDYDLLSLVFALHLPDSDLL